MTGHKTPTYLLTPNCKNKQKPETRMTVSILKRDPNTSKVQQNAY